MYGRRGAAGTRGVAVTVETPNGAEFSIWAKMYLCAASLVPQAGVMRGYPSPVGTLVDYHQLAIGILAGTLDWLQAAGFAQVWVGVPETSRSRKPMLMMRAAYSGAPGLSGRLLEATGWTDATVLGVVMGLLPFTEAPFVSFLDDLSAEFVQAGILTRGGYAAHGNVWNAEWLGYLAEAWLPEVWEVLQRVHARADWNVIERNVMHAVAVKQHTDRDD